MINTVRIIKTVLIKQIDSILTISYHELKLLTIRKYLKRFMAGKNDLLRFHNRID